MIARTFRDLEIWKKGMEIAIDVYQFTLILPSEEKFGLKSQMRKAAVSLPSNIAEGFRRRNDKEFRQFLYIALGSAAELETQVELIEQLFKKGLLMLDWSRCTPNVEILLDKLDHFQGMTMKFIKGLNI